MKARDLLNRWALEGAERAVRYYSNKFKRFGQASDYRSLRHFERAYNRLRLSGAIVGNA